MRAHVPGLHMATSLAHSMPAVFQQDEFTVQFVSAFDDVLAPVLQTLDCVDAYLDPDLTPPDFLPWLAGWVGLAIDENWTEEQTRRLVRSATELFSWQGTVHGVHALVTAWTGLAPDAMEIFDSGASTWSGLPWAEPPGDPEPEVVVRLHITREEEPDVVRLRRFVERLSPAEVRVRIELVPI